MRPIFFGLLALGLIGCKGSDLESASAELPTQYERVIKLGLPMTAAELAPPGRVPASKNAVTYLRRFGEFRDHKLEVWRDIDRLILSVSGKDWKNIERLLSEFRGGFDLIEKAASAPVYFSVHDLDMGYSLSFPNVYLLKSAIKMLSIRAGFRAYKGDIDGVIEDIGNMGALAANAGMEPGLNGVQEESWLRAQQYGAAKDVADRFRANPAALKRLVIALDNEPPEVDTMRALKEDFYAGVATCRNLDQITAFMEPKTIIAEKVDPSRLRRDNYPVDEKGRGFLARYLEYWSMFFEKTKGVSDSAEMARLADELYKSEWKKRAGESYKFVKVHSPHTLVLAVCPRRAKMWQRMAVAHTQIRLYMAENLKFPATLSDAGVTVLDPFSNKPFRLRSDLNRLDFWSVGEDGVDNGVAPKSDDYMSAVDFRAFAE